MLFFPANTSCQCAKVKLPTASPRDGASMKCTVNESITTYINGTKVKIKSKTPKITKMELAGKPKKLNPLFIAFLLLISWNLN